MRLPAAEPILKLNQQSNIRRSEGRLHIYTPALPPCNFAVVPEDFPGSQASFEQLGYSPHPGSTTSPKRSSPYLRRAFFFRNLSHRIGAGNLACYYCICSI